MWAGWAGPEPRPGPTGTRLGYYGLRLTSCVVAVVVVVVVFAGMGTDPNSKARVDPEPVLSTECTGTYAPATAVGRGTRGLELTTCRLPFCF